MTKETPGERRQANKYDKILKENAETVLSYIRLYMLKLPVMNNKGLPHDIQHTKERKPDLLQKVTDFHGKTFILHIEYQIGNDADMAYRMAEYRVMLERKYRLPVKQYVLYIGPEKLSMPAGIETEGLRFRYTIVDFSEIDYKLFLRAEKPEEKMMAIFSNFGDEKPEEALRNILLSIKAVTKGDLATDRYFRQIRVFAQLRKLEAKIIAVMNSISKYVSEEKDPFFKKGLDKGERRGLAKGLAKGELKERLEITRKLLAQTDFSLEKIAELTGQDVEFVRKVRAEMR